MWTMLGMNGTRHWADVGSRILPEKQKLGKSEILFTKIEDEAIETEVKRLQKALQPGDETKTELIGIDTFSKVDLRVAEIISAEKIKKSDKLLQLQVRIGNEQRQIVAGIAKHYKPENLIGKKVIAVVNLNPVKLRGHLSEGMLLAASSEQELSLLTVLDDLPSGSKIS